MTAGLGQIAIAQPEGMTTPAPPMLPHTFGEGVAAGWKGAFTEDRYGNMQRSLIERTNTVIQNIYSATGTKLDNPHDLQPTQAEIRENIGSSIPAIMAKRMDKLRQTGRELSGQLGEFGGAPPGLFDVDYVPQQIAQASRDAREEAARYGGVGSFVGAMGGAIASSPFDILGLGFLGATALPREAAKATLVQWTANVAREGGFQALTQTALAGPGIAADIGTRRAIGTAPSAGEVAAEVAMVAGGGFALGASVRALHAALTKIKLAGVELPPAVKDAAVVVEHDALYGDKNAIGMPAANFERVVDGATADVLAAKAPTGPYDVPIPPREPLHPLQEEMLTARNAIDNFEAEQRSAVERLNAEMLAQPRTGSEVADYAARIRQHEQELADYAAWKAGQGPEPMMLQSMRSQLRVIDQEMRDAGVPQHFEVVPPPPPSPELKAEAAQVAKQMDQPLPQAPAIPEKPGAGRPTETGPTPEEEAMVQQAKAAAETMPGGPEFLRRMEGYAEQEATIAAIAKHCKIKVT